ncbi:MAG: hypothetical protein JNL38_23140 [Myxococcales bacterium]|nr:hypothetical protein [Myxococcales bacterium]
MSPRACVLLCVFVGGCTPAPASSPAPSEPPDASRLFVEEGAPGSPAPLEPCAGDDDCALFRWDGRRCCTCASVAIRRDHERAMSARCEDGPCVQSCLQTPGTRARCVGGECRVSPAPR